jgi:hypothetical protein
MPVSAKYYGQAFVAAFNKEIDFNSDTIKVALLGTGYTPNLDTHNYFDDVVANEITGTGYTAGGATLSSAAVTYDAATNTLKLAGGNVSWSGSTLTARYAVVYDATPGSNATRPLIVLVDFDATMSSNAGVLSVNWDAAGIATVTVA